MTFKKKKQKNSHTLTLTRERGEKKSGVYYVIIKLK
jgi:hypothetical protein